MISCSDMEHPECTNRTFYETRYSAQEAAATIERDRKIPALSYNCKFCGKWHVLTDPAEIRSLRGK